MDDDECRRLTNGLYTTCSLPSDTLLLTPRPNIVLIVMEGCGAQFTDVGGHPDITPRLNSLRREGIDFAECHANSWRTDKGLVSILSGYPAFPITSLMKVPEKSRKLPAIARSLSREGYACSFFYGGDINFTNMRSYVMSSGYDRLTWKADYPRAAQQSSQWGVSDSLMFASLLSDIRQEHSRPWMKTLLTLSSHEPWDVPTHRLSDKVYNAFNYLDACLGQFIDSLRHTPQWQDLLIVILPDHGYRFQGIDETTRLYNHIPMLWVGGAVKAPRSVTAVCSQSDLAATLLGQLAIAHHDYRFSRDVLSADYRKPFAFHTFVDGLTLIDSAGFAAYDLESQHMIATEGPAADSLLQQGKALLQLFSDDLKKK
jgi:phosphoglycerol transferase MdoB-like AlkP superfamily enzyme